MPEPVAPPPSEASVTENTNENMDLGEWVRMTARGLAEGFHCKGCCYTPAIDDEAVENDGEDVLPPIIRGMQRRNRRHPRAEGEKLLVPGLILTVAILCCTVILTAALVARLMANNVKCCFKSCPLAENEKEKEEEEEGKTDLEYPAGAVAAAAAVGENRTALFEFWKQNVLRNLGLLERKVVYWSVEDPRFEPLFWSNFSTEIITCKQNLFHRLNIMFGP